MLNLHFLTHTVHKLGAAFINGFRHVAHGACQGFVVPSCSVGTCGKPCAAGCVDFALSTHRFICGALQGLGHGVQSFAGRLALVIIKSIAARIRYGFCLRGVTIDQLAECLC